MTAHKRFLSTILFVLLGGSLSAGSARAEVQKSFSDVPPGHPVFDAAEYLKTQGIITGYGDGTFKPDQRVNRAEAVTIIVRPLASKEDLALLASSVFDDVLPGDWYLPAVEYARKTLGIIDGPPKKTSFHGTDSVKKAEFIKMLLLAEKVDPVSAFGEIKLPLAADVLNPDEWYYPYIRYSLTASMTMIAKDGTLSPARELTRGDVALLLYRFLMYRAGRRTQALLSETATDIINTLDALGGNDITQAEYSSARALLAVRGARERSDATIVLAAVKTTEGFRSLVRAYRAGVSGNLDEVIRLAGDAWHIAADAKGMHAGIANLTDQLQKIAKNMADEARALKQK